MRFIITARPADNAAPDMSAGFDKELFAAYMKYNEELHKAGVLVASEGLNPGAGSARIEVSKGKRVAMDGPFAESKELVGGFYIFEVNSLDEAIQWALRCPSGLGFDDVLEIRPLTGASDIPPELLELIRTSAPTWSATFERK
jgi:hypothetical protein